MEKKELWQYFFNNPKKHYNKYMFEMPNYPDHLLYDEEKMVSLKGKWNEEIFKNENDIYLEIGCGSGNFTVGNAERHKDRNYIGVELRLKRLVLAARKSSKKELSNIIFIRKRAETIREFIADNELSGLYINFPDPWEGEEHKRIISEKLFEDLNHVMKKGSSIFFKTDHEKYYEDTLELMKDIKGYEIVYHTNDLHNSPKAVDNIKTEFEQLFLSKHKMNIKYIEILKKI